MKNRAALFGFVLTLMAVPALAQTRTNLPPGDFGPPPNRDHPPVHHILPPVIVPPPPQQSEPQGQPPVIVPPVEGGIPPLQQTDTAKNRTNITQDPTNTTLPPVAGIQKISDDMFERQSSGDESSEWILVRGDEHSVYVKTTTTTVKLDGGTILVSVRRPSKYAVIQTPDGVVSLGSDGDVLVSFIDGSLRIDNLSSRGVRCKVKLNGSVLDGNSQALAIAPGYELVAADHKLVRSEVRPADGIARRGFQLMANGHVAVNEFSVESFLSSSAIIASLAGHSDAAKEQRILKDMSKMAAVLNYINGPSGYSQSNAGLASKPGGETH
jgi:hypothetical protein